MGSRRTTTRSSLGNGRSSNGDNGSSRPSGCSYLSEVRPETRSTLCSMMAQLTEETQPSFETTLKSRAVSETSNVKFSCVVTGHPAPQVIWYKDDVQLDRYCGLPKYEIFRNGQSHSLHIYNCTVEDAAIYQASASNSKGIVSCSGVLEVGEMNEFKIHQRYFAKIKQKAENRRREAEGKENQEPLRTISPDRTQRKRRSTMEAFLSTPSSMEDEGNEGSQQAVAAETEARLQERSTEKVEEKPVPITNGALPAVTNGQAIDENSSKSGTYIYDSVQKIFTTHQPKTPFVKKKIKISNGAKIAKADTPADQASEERRAKDEISASVTLAAEEVMEVEHIVTDHQRSETDKVLLSEKPSKDENVRVEVSVPSQKVQLSPSVPPAALTSHTMSGTESKQASKHEKDTGHRDAGKNLEIQNQSSQVHSTRLQSDAAAAPQPPQSSGKEDVSKTQDVTVMDVDKKSSPPSAPRFAQRDTVSMDAPCESRTALPQRTCEQAGDQLSEKETRPRQKNVSVSRPALLSEVTQAHAKMNKNDAPVNLELPLNQRVIDVQPPQKTPSEREPTTDDIQTCSLNHGPRTAIDKMTQDTWDHSRGSNESHTVLFTDLQKSPLQSPGGVEDTRGCNVSPSAQQNQVDTAIKTVERTEIQVDEEVDGSKVAKLLVQSGSVAPNEKTVEMETESAARHVNEHTKTEKTKDAVVKVICDITVDPSNNRTEKNERMSQTGESTHLELQNPKSKTPEPVISRRTKTPENTDLSQMKEIQTPVTKVISVAELLRSQIRALEASLENSVTPTPAKVDFAQDPTPASKQTCEELSKNGNEKMEVKKSMPERKTEARTDETPPTNIKETLMEVFRQLNQNDQVENERVTLPPVQALQKPLVIPPISVVDTGTAIETEGLHDSAKKYKDGVMDICPETRASILVSKHPEINSQESGTPVTVTPIKASEDSNVPPLRHTKDGPVKDKDMESMLKLSPEATMENGLPETVLDQRKFEEHDTKASSLLSEQKFPTKITLATETPENCLHFIQQDSSMLEDFTNKTPQASPSLKRRNCVSPIPSATAQELALGARRKILLPKAKPEEASEATTPVDNQTQKKDVSMNSKNSTHPANLSTSPSLSRRSPLLQPPGEQNPPSARRSPLVSRRRTTSETQALNQQPTEEIQTPKTEEKPGGKDKLDPFKAPQVIRKIRGETFADASGHLKLWCQFFNVLSDSTVKWYRNDKEIAQAKKNAGDETQVNLAVVQASSKDSGVYGCTITNEYGTDSTDCLLSSDVLAGMSLREDLGVGEEIEMTPMIFSKGVADSGVWGNKFFGRIMMQESHIGDGCVHKVWRAKVIYGLEPVFESGNTCIIKARNPIAYGGKGESCLTDRNLDIVKQDCKIQNLAREYCKIFSAEARVIEHFGPCLEVIPVYLMYRPANTVPYATVEADLTGVYQKYCVLDHTGRMDVRTGSEVEQKCCTLQHWIFQWTNGNLLLTRLEGVDTKITNVEISVKSTGHQGLSLEGNPKVFEQFVSQHQCNYFCGLLGLRSLKLMDSLLTPARHKGSRSPLLQRKLAAGSSSPQTGRKAAGSPRMPRKTEQEGRSTPTKQKATDAPKVVKME